MDLNKYGFNDYFKNEFKQFEEKGMQPARVAMEEKGMYKLYTEVGEVTAKVSGKFQYEAISNEDFPAVGDFVAVSIRKNEMEATIHAVLKRKSCFTRKKNVAVDFEAQIFAANFDYVFIVTSLNHNFNLRRIERYLTMVWNTGGIPVLILSKADLCDNLSERLEEVQEIAMGVSVHAISSFEGIGIGEISRYLTEGKTAVVVGSSGVGKSTLLNKLAGEELMETSEIRENDSRGRHTTTHRELFIVPSGGIIIDTPGTRLIGIWDADTGVDEAFQDIEEFAKKCKFSNCEHKDEPGCAVRRAIEEGTIDEKRLESYLKLKKETRFMEAKQKRIIRIQQKNSAKSKGKGYKRDKRVNYGY
ncbi:ribosome small subunit-dependent GTPase A [Clostridium hydrogenum]|uniref:ribosome small subunit-dependent GTPase A n=1 Tax=Clostridium hydrogenum TaxID=2855764 RepID=UPI001F2974C1|nr:ribosome small subunit-dependent GTPase A [Clostridium hydrogenum]